jgi:hypothetical protein
MVLVGLSAAVIGGALYGLVSVWIWYGFIRVVLWLICALTLAVLIGGAAKHGKIRSSLFVTVVALFVSLVGLWIYWGTYDVARHGFNIGLEAWTPARLFEHGQELFDKGSWGMKKTTVTGWLLVAFWVAEAVLLTLMVVGLARSEVSSPFCESCLEWTESTTGLMRLAADGKEPAWQEVLSGDLPALAVFESTDSSSSPHVRLDLASCPKCEHSNFVTLTAVTISKDKKGKTTTTERPLVVSGAISDPEAEFLRQFAKQLHGDDQGDDSNASDDEDEEFDDDDFDDEEFTDDQKNA